MINDPSYKDRLFTMSSEEAIRELIVHNRALDDECKEIIALVIIEYGSGSNAYNYAHITGLNLDIMLEVLMNDWTANAAAMWLKYIKNSPTLYMQFKRMAVKHNVVVDYINFLNAYKLISIKVTMKSFYEDLPDNYKLGVII